MDETKFTKLLCFVLIYVSPYLYQEFETKFLIRQYILIEDQACETKILSYYFCTPI